MNDLISRRSAIKAIKDLPDCHNGYSDTYDKACIVGVLEEVPTVDAVPVIRCKNCKYYEDDIGDCIGFADGHYVAEEEYCSRARRKEENGN